VTGGAGVLGAASLVTDATGNAPNTLRLAPVSSEVHVTACVAPTNNPCKIFDVFVVPVSALQIQAVSGTQQLVTEGQPLAPVTVLVTDDSIPPYPVFAAPVTFLNILSRSGTSGPTITVDDVVGNPNSDPVILGSATTVLASDSNGLAMIAPWAALVTAGEEVNGLATVDSGAQVGFSLQVLPAPIVDPARVGAAANRPGHGSSVPRTGQQAPLGEGQFFGMFPGMFPVIFVEMTGGTPEADSAEAPLKDTESRPFENGSREEASAELVNPTIAPSPDERPHPKSAMPTKYAASQTKSQNKFEENSEDKSQTKPNQSYCERCSGAVCAEALVGK
jgi:hypothetical protein